MYKSLLFFVTFLINYNNVLCDIISENPCPNIFQYGQNRGGMFGRIVIPNDYTGTYNIQVNVSYAALINQNIRLKLITPGNKVIRGAALAYDLIFPVDDILPRVTQILFNNRIICAGKPEELRPGGSVTNMWAQHQLRTSLNRIPQNTGVEQENYFLPTAPIQENITPETDFNNLFSNPSTITQNPFTNYNFNDNEFIPNLTPITPAPPILPPVEFTVPTRRTTVRTTTRRRIPIPTEPPATTPLNQIGFIPSGPIFTSPPRISVPNYGECGVTGSQQLVFGGSNVNPGEFPWLVAIYLKEQNNIKYICTGNLISKKHVMTAGHCVVNQVRENILCVFGIHNINNWASSQSIFRNVLTSNVHQDYKPKNISSDADVAILVLDKEIEYQRNIRPICMWQGADNVENFLNNDGLVVGWGKTNVDNEFSPVPKSISLPIVSIGRCYESAPDYFSILSNRTFCAGKQDNTGPCTGDSGAGFIMKVNDKWRIRGIVSRALTNEQKSCNLQHYIVFSDVAKMMNWVNFILTL